MPLSTALEALLRKGYLIPLEQRPLPDPLPPKHDRTKYYAYHQQTGHETDSNFRLCHDVQDLFDNKVIAAPAQQSLSPLDQ